MRRPNLSSPPLEQCIKLDAFGFACLILATVSSLLLMFGMRWREVSGAPLLTGVPIDVTVLGLFFLLACVPVAIMDSADNIRNGRFPISTRTLLQCSTVVLQALWHLYHKHESGSAILEMLQDNIYSFIILYASNLLKVRNKEESTS